MKMISTAVDIEMSFSTGVRRGYLDKGKDDFPKWDSKERPQRLLSFKHLGERSGWRCFKIHHYQKIYWENQIAD